jgi:hypothetical protein
MTYELEPPGDVLERGSALRASVVIMASPRIKSRWDHCPGRSSYIMRLAHAGETSHASLTPYVPPIAFHAPRYRAHISASDDGITRT